jgi:hypothetical protein
MDDPLITELRLLYNAIGKTAEYDLSKAPSQVYRSAKGVLVYQDFRGGHSDDDLQNDIELVIHSIGSLRDHIREWAKAGSRDAGKINEAIRRSRDLQIIMDLWNLKKHHTLTRPEWSGLSPRLANFNSHLRLTTATGERHAFWTPSASSKGNHIVTTADVLNKDGGHIGDFHEIAGRALEAWKQLINRLV